MGDSIMIAVVLIIGLLGVLAFGREIAKLKKQSEMIEDPIQRVLYQKLLKLVDAGMIGVWIFFVIITPFN